jgi:nitrite reductase (NADH) large subunit
MSKRIVVVGHGMVGQRFLETLTQDANADFSVTMLAEEPRLAYDRVNLSKYFSGSSVEDLTLTTREFFDKNGIELYSGDPVSSIDRAGKRVITRSGAEYEYDVLVLATGSSPFVPPIPGRDRPNVFVYRTIDDLEAISEAGKNSTRGVVIGGGLLGLEAAKALKDLGLTTHVVEFAPFGGVGIGIRNSFCVTGTIIVNAMDFPSGAHSISAGDSVRCEICEAAPSASIHRTQI